MVIERLGKVNRKTSHKSKRRVEQKIPLERIRDHEGAKSYCYLVPEVIVIHGASAVSISLGHNVSG